MRSAEARIVSARSYMIRVPFGEDILWTSGRRTGVTRVIVRLETEGGVIGWGESICLIEPVHAVLSKIVCPLLEGYDIADIERFGRHVLGAGYYHHKRAAVMAIAAAEMAMWDALGKTAGLPLWALWGGKWRDTVSVSAYLFSPDPQINAEKARAFLARGYRTFKAKIGFGIEQDLAIVSAVRDAVGPCDLRADVNGAWTPGTARRCLRRLAPFDLAYVEQPLQLDDLRGLTELRALGLVPIALDESAYTLEDTVNIVREGAADVVLLDPHEAGGLWQTIKAAAVCEGAGIPVTLHSGGELALSQAAYVHLAASIPNMSIAIDTEQSYLADDIAHDRPEIEDGGFCVPDRPGLGVTVDEDKLEAFATDTIEGAYLDESRPGWFSVKPSY